MKEQIEKIFNNPSFSVEDHGSLIEEVLSRLDQGVLRVCEKKDQGWEVFQWVKQAILLYFRYKKMEPIHTPPFSFCDKIPLKQWTGKEKVRVVPQALARYGSFVDEGSILMPSYVNIGAHVGRQTLVDTWATVGSCAQIGSRVHISGGVGIGGVLEPLQAHPVIIEDDCFIGSRCILVEGVHLESGVVLGAGVTLTGSTKILDVSQENCKEYKGFVPKNSVVIPGARSKEFKAGSYSVPCALIIGKRKTSTDIKTSLNDVLRDFEVPV